ncbi:hypothetical protein Tco_0392643 [Tanacetum coccineum]
MTLRLKRSGGFVAEISLMVVFMKHHRYRHCKLTSRFDVPKYIDQRLYEQQQIIVELQKKNEAQDILLNEVYNFYKGQLKPVEVREHYGLNNFSGFQNSQGFQQAVPKMFTTQASRSSHVGGVNPDAMHYGKRETFPSKYQLSLFTCMPDTTVAPKKWANNIRNTTRNAIVSNTINLEKAGIDLNSQVEELVYLGSCATDDYISLHNVDHTKALWLHRQRWANKNKPNFTKPESSFAFGSYDENENEQNDCFDGVDENPQPVYHKWKKFMSFKPDIPETPLYNSKPIISKHYKKYSEVKIGNTFDNKEALDLAVRLKPLEEGYQFLSKKTNLDIQS